jgi:hypothetical protein
VGVRDGQIAALIASGQVKPRGDVRPSYVRGDGAPSRTDVAAQRATLSRLAALFPKNTCG